jgi:tetratricopeptide (TPR) repeat protein
MFRRAEDWKQTMRIEMRFARTVTTAIMLCLFAVGASYAQSQSEEERSQQKTKQAQAVSKAVYDKLTAAQEASEAKKFDDALRILQDLRNSDKLSEYELQNVLNYFGFIYYSMDRIPEAMQAYEDMIRIPSIEPQLRLSTLYTLSQLNTMQENYPRAIQLLQEWFKDAPNPAPEPYILLAQNFYQVSSYSEMVVPIETAIDVANSRGTPLKEEWYTLLNFAYFQQENYVKVRDIQKILLENWPRKRYWFSLAGAYTELGDEENVMAAYDAAHTQGMLETESELRTMAQLYMQAEVPYKAAVLLDKEINAKRVKGDADNWRLLSQAWSLAAEDERAVPALQQAARLSSDGDLDLRLGNAYLNLGQYAECESSVENAFKKGSIKNEDSAYISLGMCQYNQRKYQSAIRAFRNAGKTQRSARISRQWIAVIESDIEREEQIRLAEAAARKQRDALEKRSVKRI